MSTRNIIGAVGAAIGFYIGGPQGAQIGWTIGNFVGNAVDPMILKGPQIGDLAQQTSQEGVPRPIVFGLSPPMGGNIIATSDPRTVRRRTEQGKGGPKVETETVHRTYAIGICEGPITRVVRVWRNAALVWDDRSQDEFNFHDLTEDEIVAWAVRLALNNQAWELGDRVQFYEGTYDQMPDPSLEDIFGVGTTPAFRGTAYMVVFNDDLTDMRGAIPQYMFQVERCEGSYLTSRPYAVESIDAIVSTGDFLRPSPSSLTIEALDSGGTLQSAELRALLDTYTDGDPEAMDTEGALQSGELRTALLTYTDGDPEAMDTEGALLSGELDTVLIQYTDGDPEALNSSGALLSGTLT